LIDDALAFLPYETLDKAVAHDISKTDGTHFSFSGVIGNEQHNPHQKMLRPAANRRNSRD
jgi:hypothetical protein